MLSIQLISACLIAQTGSPNVPAGPVRVVVSEVAECHECGVKVAAIRSAIRCLETSPPRHGPARTRPRRWWRIKTACHPEVVPALSEALLRDPVPLRPPRGRRVDREAGCLPARGPSGPRASRGLGP